MYSEITPLIKYPRISKDLDIDLLVKHDDLYPFVGGGSKARKIKYIIEDAQYKKSNALVSAGAANSNHARVVAIKAAQLGWPVKLIIHDKENYNKSNLYLMKLAGAELIFCEHNEVATMMDSAMSDFIKEGLNPYYIWGGGHSIEGMKAYYDAVHEFGLQNNKWVPDFVVLASGTGGTQAGLHLGFSNWNTKSKVIGISVARDKNRGISVIDESISMLSDVLKVKNNNQIYFYDEWNGGGYELVDDKIKENIEYAARREGLILDSTYTGKAFTGLVELIRLKLIPARSKVLFWHTGGLLNLI